ncbi:2-amino-4-hydroxy-6-hydroxymethyldihydropteridine diphosphokinase [Gracilaria domingensis]|nr:2-amino-4-hydroxy-6-hydroxymethyldihydropteridine diphosphokinase [Gracilaria domingensis]KAI0563473.1 2-amino-4-hydroxy-6-hydroxymethyldihydropteridine diphosphokinase [Gracilaria domingensis]KAI0563474.1 2-amino-4-hydroxy-6-hydroxymethyldihydropteridine diphosphokinase [Gracilaria domingensis]KAI0563476.1 2-amino-4-hydroxy-6-hydroxymethyldihydropteridine diphosphokinase [Gracilaria domingensis]
MDKVVIKDLLVRAILGIRHWEREKEQDILINITIFTDTTRAAHSDDIGDCVDYSAVAKKVKAHAECAKRRTVEALANDLARICLQEKLARKVLVYVEKPGAVRFSRSVGVEIERHRDEGILLLSNFCEVKSVSSAWETESVGCDGPNFLNAAMFVLTSKNADEFKASVIRPIEAQLGRKRCSNRNAPRPIDIDIELFNGIPLDLSSWKQAFCLVPLSELIPDYEYPIRNSRDRQQQKVAEVAAKMRDQVWMRKREDVTVSRQMQAKVKENQRIADKRLRSSEALLAL